MAREGRRARRRPFSGPILRTGVAVAAAFAVLAAGAGYWQVVDAQRLSEAPDNPLVVAAARHALRGDILDRNGNWLARTRRDQNGETFRVYRDPVASPVVGYFSRRYGTVGLEKTYDAELRGITRADAVADVLKKFDPNPADPLKLQLSLDLRLQRAAVRQLGSQRGAVVMLDPTTGEILALASTPTYDASVIAGQDAGAADTAFAALRNDGSQPLLPRATLGRYTPGSVFKIVTAIAGLDAGAIGPDTTFAQQPAAEKTGLLVSGFRIRDGHHPQTGNRELDFADAVEVSCNIWFALAGLAMGGQTLMTGAQRLGFGSPIPFDLPTAVSQVTGGKGRLPGGFEGNAELASASFGQGQTFVTPLQMALVASAVANRGVLMRPRLVTALTGEKSGTRTLGPEVMAQVTSPQNATVIAGAMQRAVEGDLGRLFTTGAKVPGVPTAGKSGTAELGGTGEPHSWFIGFAPVDHPRVAIAVLVERGGRGAEAAAPIAGRMMKQYFDLYGGGSGG
ncbi:MAG: peptidoglycan D,D-transpeptidase FtsI family protein [Chloroflexota bacterium]